MVAQLKQHIELRGDNPYNAVITDTNLKAALVAQFAIGWGVSEAVENYDLPPAMIYSALAFYHDNLESIQQHNQKLSDELSPLENESKRRFDELKQRYNNIQNSEK